MRIVCLITAVCWLACTSPALAGERLSIDGYVKSFGIYYHFVDPTGGPGELSDEVANNNRIRIETRYVPATWLSFDCAYDVSVRFQNSVLFEAKPLAFSAPGTPYRYDDLKNRITPDNVDSNTSSAIFQNLDRLQATARIRHFDLIVGRQAIAWGSAHAVNPTDIISPFLYTEIDTEDRVGVDAARLRASMGSLAEVDAGCVAGKDLEWKHSAAFLRGRFSIAKSDASLIGMIFRENALLGIDITRPLGGAGVWVEAAFVGTDADSSSNYVRLSAGTDYHFSVGNGLYGFLEYHFNGAGSTSASEYVINARSNPAAYIDGAVYLLGRHYLIPGASYQAGPLTTLFAEMLLNLSDGSVLFAPYLEYNMTENTYVSIGAYGRIGKGPRATTGNPSTIDGIALRSEFGSYPGQLFVFLRYYF